MITPEMYNELRIQEQQGQEMADEKNKSIQLRKDIMKLALAESATDCTIMCGTLFAKFNVSIHEQMAKNLKTTLQTFFDNRKKNDCHVQMSLYSHSFCSKIYDWHKVISIFIIR